MRVLAIGDIHGCSSALDALVDAVALRPGDQLVTLGDYVDRGPDSRGVLDRLIRLADEGYLVPLRGNHEQMLLRARTNPDLKAMWFRVGGVQTLASYAPPGGRGTFDDIPAAHWTFLERTCATFHETDTHFFVHAGAAPDEPLARQRASVLLWEPFINPRPHCSGKVMVCGHTAQRDGRPRSVGHAICIDTWACGAGWLTCLDVGSGQLWQANQEGKIQQGWL
ncbi:metallophosphoesterase family protein [Chondromyces apiculatus]|uniref:Serine/threonine protein phosphatase n=1 Tax=Chondromyces apiculatus DSM 436 TaxID=1192034 RepID=A0A017T0E6_9BACT|nr:metallophosphoesterase family protein [Chondromyces apiculatus]EYF02688.1 serine/threonine protein phosphatase [Chondromyces apiculatus DSM 436]